MAGDRQWHDHLPCIDLLRFEGQLMTPSIPDDAFIEAFNEGGAKRVTERYGGDPTSHRVRAAKLRKRGHDIKKFKSGRPQKGNNESV